MKMSRLKQKTEEEKEYSSDFMDLHQFSKTKVQDIQENKSDGQLPQEERIQNIHLKNTDIEKDSGYSYISASLTKQRSRPMQFEDASQPRNEQKQESNLFDGSKGNQQEEDATKMHNTCGNTVSSTTQVYQKILEKIFEIFKDVSKDCFLPFCVISMVLFVACILYYLIPYIYFGFKKESDSDDELRVLIIGQSGSGKSSLANTILGHETFKSNALGDSQTKTIYAGNTHRFGRNIVVVDTPGLFDRSMSNSEVLFEIAKCYAVTSPGLHSILLTIAIGRIDNQNLQETVDLFLEEFGETALSFMIVVFTNKHLLEAENMSIEDYLSSFSKSSSLLTLLQKIKGRYVAVGYKGDRRERIKEAETIISMIDKMLRDQPLKLFQNEVYKKTEKTLTTEAERMVQAVKHNQNVEKKISKMNPQEIRLRTRKIIIEEKYSDENDGENEISFSKILKQILSFIVRSKIGI